MSFLDLLSSLAAAFSKKPATACEPAPAPAPAAAPLPPPAPAIATEPVYSVAARRCSPKGAALIKSFESCSLRSYPDPASPMAKALRSKGLWTAYMNGAYAPVSAEIAALSGAPWTIGWGSTGPDVGPNMKITQAEADARFERDLAVHCAPIARLVQRPLTQGQYDACASFIFNCGGSNFEKSGLLRGLNSGDFQAAADNLLLWNKAGGQVMPGLVRRRAAERALFLS